MRLSFTRLQPPRSFFNPSYRTLCRPLQPPPTPRPTTADRRSFSFNSGGSSSRSGSSSNPVKGNQQAAATSSATATATPAGGKGAHSPASPTNSSAASGNSAESPKAEAEAPTTPLAASIPHASSGLVSLDAFFALHRPLLELPIKISARKTVIPIPRLVSIEELESTGGRANVVDEQVREAMEAMDGEELVEVVDLGPDGSPVGPSYVTTLSAWNAAEGRRTPEEEEELKDLQLEANEAALKDIEDGLPDPYAAWLISEHEPHSLTPSVSRYLASHPPFSTPPPPAPISTSESSSSSSPPPPTAPSRPSSLLTAQAQSDLSFLRPFPLPTLTSSSSTSTPPSTDLTNDTFTASFVSPLSPTAASQLCDRFLSTASLSHRWESQIHYVAHVSEPLEIARRHYDGIESPRIGFFESRKRGEVRVWREREGWSRVGGESRNPFMPAEMVDLDWEDEVREREGQGVRMDSVKRKRRKKITKHKFKKRR